MYDSVEARDDEARRRLAHGESAAEIAFALQMPRDVVDRIEVIAGSKVERREPEQPSVAYNPSEAARTVLDAIGWSVEERAPSRPRCSRRDAALCESLILEDITLDEAGKRVPCTKQNVSLILRKHTGLTTTDLKNYRVGMREARRLGEGTRAVLRLASDSPSVGLAELARVSGLTSDEVVSALGTEESLRRRASNSWTVGASETEILEHLRLTSRLPGGNPLTSDFYDENRPDGAVSSIRVGQRFGTWTAACQAAGVDYRAPKRTYKRGWSQEEFVEWVRACVADEGPRVSYRRFTTWLQERYDQSAPSSQKVRDALGGWVPALRLAIGDEGATTANVASPSGEPALLGLPESRWTGEETDSKVFTNVRLEQSFLRGNLLGERAEVPCDLCRRVFPQRLLIAAHIVPRRILTNEERRRFEKIAMIACAACDALFEWGYLVVGGSGNIEPGRPAETEDLELLVAGLTGVPCPAFSAENAPSFARHRVLHTTE